MSAAAPQRGPCERLDWDSAFFGLPVARVIGERLDEARAREVDAWCGAHGVALLYFEAAIDDPATVAAAERHGYALVDVRVALDRDLPPELPKPPPGVVVEPAAADDLPALRGMARSGFRDSRFYFDARLPDERCDALYERWVEESLAGWAQRVLVVRPDRARGFVTCHLDDEPGGRIGRIGLVAVDADSRGRGTGEGLVAGALAWFAAAGAGTARVATQARNVGAQRLYAKLGFRVRRTSLYYHKWFEGHA